MNPNTRRRGPRRVALPVATAIALLAACGGDDDAADTTSAATTTAAPPGTTAGDEYCALVEEINGSDAPPTVEQIEAYRAVAPEAVQAPLQVVVDLLDAADGNFFAVFGDPRGGAALEEITAFEVETCGIEAPDEGPEQDPSVTVLDAAATRIDVTGTEYAFHADFPTAAGRYSFVLDNQGAEPHLMILLRLEDGASLDDVLASEGETGVAEEFESGFALPGAEGVLTADLGPGEWVMLCPIPNAEQTPHFVDGMIHEFTVA